MIQINNYIDTKMLTPKELSQLLPLAQTGDEFAIGRLCEAFAPLIYKLSHRKTTFTVLGEDAENTAWLWFLEFINDYRVYNFKKFPGLVRKYLIFKFVRLMKQQGTQWDKEMQADIFCEENPFGGAEDDDLNNLLNKISLRQELSKLTLRQRKILDMYFVHQHSQQQIATILHCAVRTVGYQKDLAVKLIRDKFYK